MFSQNCCKLRPVVFQQMHEGKYWATGQIDERELKSMSGTQIGDNLCVVHFSGPISCFIYANL